jgi:hypothetical protein
MLGTSKALDTIMFNETKKRVPFFLLLAKILSVKILKDATMNNQQKTKVII